MNGSHGHNIEAVSDRVSRAVQLVAEQQRQDDDPIPNRWLTDYSGINRH